MTLRSPTDTGSGSVWVLCMASAVACAAAAATAVALTHARHAQAVTAADFAALRAADVLERGGPATQACAAAAAMAAANGATVASCVVTNAAVTVTVSARGAIRGHRVGATARAGPVVE